MISEWDPIVTPKMKIYAETRLNNGRLELRMTNTPNYIISMDEKIIPHLIQSLQRMLPLEERNYDSTTTTRRN
jgi:hypothetical protein